MVDKKTKLARNLAKGDRAWLKLQSTLGWGFESTYEVFTISKKAVYPTKKGIRVLIYAEEMGDRPVAWLRGSARVCLETK